MARFDRSSSSAYPPSGAQPQPSRQAWEAAVLTRFFPPRLQEQVKAALLTPGPIEPYRLRSWEARQRYQPDVLKDTLVAYLCKLLRDELQAGQRLVQTPLSELCRLERNGALAFHAIHVGQLYYELARRPGVQANQEVQRILATI